MDNVITKRCSKQSHGCPCQGCKATNHTVTLRNLPNPASGTYTSTHRNSPALQNLPELHTPARTGTLRNLLELRNPPEPPEPTPPHTVTFGNLPEHAPQTEPKRNHHTPESGTFRNLPPEPAPATRTGTHGSLSGLKTPLA